MQRYLFLRSAILDWTEKSSQSTVFSSGDYSISKLEKQSELDHSNFRKTSYLPVMLPYIVHVRTHKSRMIWMTVKGC